MIEFIFYTIIACCPIILIAYWVNEIPKIVDKYENKDK